MELDTQHVATSSASKTIISQDWANTGAVFQGDASQERSQEQLEGAVDDGDKDENEDRGYATHRAPDGGYGWFVVLGCFIMHVIMGGLDRSEGVFFLLLLDTFGQSAQLTSWPGAIVCTLQLVMGPLANALCARYSVRASVMVGGVLASAGLILNCFSTSVYFLFFSHALVGGVGRGLVYGPGLVIVGMYFDKRVGLAAGLGTSGVGLGTFFIVPLTQFLSEHYGFAGTFLLIGGLVTHLLVAGMLFRPLSTHYRITQRHRYIGEETRNRRPEQGQTLQDIEERKSLSARINENEKTLSIIYNGENCQQAKRQERSLLAGMYRWIVSSLRACFPRDKHGEMGGARAPSKLFHFYLLKEPPFLLYCVSIWLFAMSFRAAFTFMPALVKSKGIPESEAALALSVAGVVDSVGRIASGLILDTALLRPYRPALYTCTIFGVAAVAVVLPSLQAFGTFCVFCGLYGFFTGAFISQKSVVLGDFLGQEHMSSSLGLLIAFQGFGNLLGPPLAGYLRDNLGTFDEAFYLGGGLLAVSGLLMVVGNVFLRTSMPRPRQTESVQ